MLPYKLLVNPNYRGSLVTLTTTAPGRFRSVKDKVTDEVVVIYGLKSVLIKTLRVTLLRVRYKIE